MTDKESDLTKMVKKSLAKAAKKGEDLNKKVFSISYDAVVLSLRTLRNFNITDEIKGTIEQDVLAGIIEGAKELNISSSMLAEFANLGIIEGLEIGSINEAHKKV